MKKLYLFFLLSFCVSLVFSQSSSWKDSKPSWKNAKTEQDKSKSAIKNKISQNSFEQDLDFTLGFWDLDFNVKLKLLDGVCYYRINLNTEDRLFNDTKEYEAIKESYNDKKMFTVAIVNEELITIHNIGLLKGSYIRMVDYNEDVTFIYFNGEFICSQEKFNEFSNINVTTRMLY